MAEIVAMPKLGFDMAEGTLVRWVIDEGAEVAKGAVLAEIETDKATVEVRSTAAGILYRRLVPEGEVVPVGTPIAVIAAPGEEVKDIPEAGAKPAEAEKTAEGKPEKAAEKPAAEIKAVPAEEPAKEAPVVEESGMVKASPLARRMAAESSIDLRAVRGSGPGGRIVKKDIEQARVGRAVAKPAPASAGQPAPVEKAGLPAPA